MLLKSVFLITLFFFFFLFPLSTSSATSPPATVCIVGSGIAGSSLAHFLRRYSLPSSSRIIMFDRNPVVGGRMATVTIAGHTFEAGASILHPKNYHAANFTEMYKLGRKKPVRSESSISLAIWDGQRFVFKTMSVESKSPLVQKIVSLANSVYMLFHYGFSLLKMDNFVEDMLSKFLKYYESFETRPIFETVDEMLKWAGLYNLTTRTLEEELFEVGLSPLLVKELVTVITRINYGQNVDINGLAGAVSLAGSGGGLWAVEGGNWRMAAGLINSSDVELHLLEEITSISYLGKYYELSSTHGKTYTCEVSVIATPLDEVNIQFAPRISIPKRNLQHTHATFVRGLLNPVYFGMKAVSEIPELVGTIEDVDIPFSSISVLKQHNETDMTYKIFSRKVMDDALLDDIFSARTDTIRINWAAYPHYNAPEVFAPFILDSWHLYYVNAFENAASTMETSAVAAENVARLILSRLFGDGPRSSPNCSSDEEILHSDL
ncbi:hypothetical protein K2173_000929 [Erythroxylum novogranatense]|uniref:Prenylcysteine lyase domain-containing protein n=1 Tax=Erythroxylum novogranatense TaxID=1862640 RepID=A0AAV8TTD4_9ROSI|nr:hypothetical protein K2173_000929 [Erythroxylum novogranatense]